MGTLRTIVCAKNCIYVDRTREVTRRHWYGRQLLWVFGTWTSRYPGHVDAGKSTLMGRLLYELGRMDEKKRIANERGSSKLG